MVQKKSRAHDGGNACECHVTITQKTVPSLQATQPWGRALKVVTVRPEAASGGQSVENVPGRGSESCYRPACHPPRPLGGCWPLSAEARGLGGSSASLCALSLQDCPPKRGPWKARVLARSWLSGRRPSVHSRPRCACWFPMAVLTRGHRVAGSKQHRHILLRSWRPQSAGLRSSWRLWGEILHRALGLQSPCPCARQ